MSIQITIQAETGTEARQKLAELLGTATATPIYDESGAGSGAAAGPIVQNDDRHVSQVGDIVEEMRQAELHPAAIETTTPVEPPKKRGRPSKTDKAAAAAPEAPAQISTGEARTAPDDPPEVEAQDAADEQAESEALAAAEAARKASLAASETPAKALTHNDLKDAMGVYVHKFGMAATREDGFKIFEGILGPVPAGTKNAEGKDVTAWVLSAVPEARLAEAVAGWKAAAESNPYGRAVAA